jgi:predicted transcriptional regulator
MDRHRIDDRSLSGASGVSPRQIAYLRLGQSEPTRPTMAALLSACVELSGKSVRITDLFDFEAERRAS